MATVMGELSLSTLPTANQWEDRWFRWIVLGSIVLHSMVFLAGKQAPTGAASQAAHQAIMVSLSLLQAQETQQRQAKPVAKQQLPEKKTSRPKTQHNKSAHLPVPAVLPTVEQYHPLTTTPTPTPTTAPRLAQHVVRGTEVGATTANEAYLAKLLRHIESFKFYPRVAQRRGIQGEVQVSFLLMARGDIAALHVRGGHLLLQQAARAAVQGALPMLAPPKTMTVPFNVSFVMQFQMPSG